MSSNDITTNEKLLRFIIVPKVSPNVNFDDERKYKTFIFKKDIKVGELKGLIFKKTNLKTNITMNPLDDLSIAYVPKIGLDTIINDNDNFVKINEINICMMNNNNSIFDMFERNLIKSGYCFQVVVHKHPKTNDSLSFLSDSITKVNNDVINNSLIGNIGNSLFSSFTGFGSIIANTYASPVINPAVASVYAQDTNVENTNNDNDNFEYMWEDEDTTNTDFIVW
jgi:hypothetical protein